jgi:hypothetical protein
MSNVISLRAEGVKHAEIRKQIAEAFGLDDDDQALIDTLEGQSDFADLCAAALREANARKAMAEGLTQLIDEMCKRKERLLHSYQRTRAIVAEAMLNAGERKLMLPDMTVSVRMGKPRLIIDEAALSDRYKIPQVVFKTNKEAIQADVDKGDVPEGVQIANPQPVITVRGG